MRIISRKTLRLFWESSVGSQAKQPLLAWFDEVRKARWFTPADIKSTYRSADFVAKDPVIFNIGGNKFRLIVSVKYGRRTAAGVAPGIVFIRFVGTHRDYDQIDPTRC